MSHTAYSAYQPARHLWLDQIPSHWDSVNIRLIAKRSSDGTPDKSNSLFWSEGTIPWLNSGEVNQGVITEPTTYITEDALSQSSAKWIPPNSIIIALAGQGKTKGMAAITTFRTTCNQSMAAVIFETDYPKFMYWWLVSQYKNIRGMASDDARDGLNLEMIATIPCPRPSDDEQQKIAAFLDWKTGQIDALIAKKNELMEKLKEKRLAVITQAVTKGVNSAAPMRDSGIPWLGSLPKHWKTQRTRFAISANPPAPRLRALKPDVEISFIPMDAVGVQGGLNLEQTRLIADVGGGYTEFQDGDVVVAKITPCFENGKAAIASGLMNGAASGTTELHILRAGASVEKRFLFYVVTSDTFSKLGESEMYGAGG